MSMRMATRFLLKFICSQGPTDYRAKAKAFSCLFSVGDEELIAKSFASNFEDLLNLHRDMCYRSRLLLFNEQLRAPTLSPETVDKLVRNFMARKADLAAGVFPTLFELCLDFGIHDKVLLMEIIAEMEKNRKRFLMTHISRLFTLFPEYKADPDFQNKFILALSAPLDEFVAQRPETCPLHTYHQGVISDTLSVLATKPVVLNYWIIGGESVPWGTAITKLCSTGLAAFATELGSFVVEQDIRLLVLQKLLDVGLYDNVIAVGFHTGDVYQYLRAHHFEEAVEQLRDRHLKSFVQWLAEQGDYDSIRKAHDLLNQQGRSGDAKEIAEQYPDQKL